MAPATAVKQLKEPLVATLVKTFEKLTLVEVGVFPIQNISNNV